MSHPVHSMRYLLFQLFGLSLYDSLDKTIASIRKSIFFMEKIPVLTIEDLTTRVIEFSNVIDVIQDEIGSGLPSQERFWLFYMIHMVDLDPHKAYGLLGSNRP